jgi:DNA polymerase I-like protein with 3'-5' exonuclease and polymerase domains
MTESSWRPPSDLSNLNDAKIISIDTETNDPNLKKLGPGGVRKDGHLAGVSIATDTGFIGYFPIGHNSGNMDKAVVLRWLSDVLSSDTPKCGANLLYDLEWLHTEGVAVNGPLWDVQVAEPLLNENRLSFSLQSLAEDYLDDSKDEELLNIAADTYGIKNIKANLWKLPSKYVGAYAEQDAALPIEIFLLQKDKLKKEDLWDLFLLESKLQSVLFKMRIKGVAVDIDKTEQLHKEWGIREQRLYKEMEVIAGNPIDIWSNKNIAKAYDSLGLPYYSTWRGNPSFTQQFLSAETNPLAGLILQARKLNKARGTFLKNMILDHSKNGRIYTQFHQLRRDDGGTVSGRFSSSNPNLQQVPARGGLGPEVRALFIPDEGLQWGKFDYSQQEPRVTIHYAEALKFPGALQALEQFKKDPSTDYHGMIAKMANVDRTTAKTLNLGMTYGMGTKRMMSQLGFTPEESKRIFYQYHEEVPFIKGLSEYCTNVVTRRGYLRTILGRKRRFELWEPINTKEREKPLSKQDALEAYGTLIRRSFTHKALNALIQGSSADMMKTAIVHLDQEGYTPQLTVHDEVDLSIEGTKDAKVIKEIMENCMPEINVPILCDAELGSNWGNVK